MLQKVGNRVLPGAHQLAETSFLNHPTSIDLLEDCLTPTTLSFFNSAMSEGSGQTLGSLAGMSRPGMEGSSEEETGGEDDSCESFDARSMVVPTTAGSSAVGSGGDGTRKGASGERKVKSLKRKLPGPRPAFSDDELTEEEMQRRMRRRERNKMAAARCRQRRVDQTNELLHETKHLESEASRLEKEIESLEKLKTKLEIVLQSHIPLCTANVQDRQPTSAASSGPFQAPPSPPLYLTSNPQSSLVLVTLSQPAQADAPSDRVGLLPVRPSTLTVPCAPMASEHRMASDGSLFNFNLPPVSSSPLNSASDLHFSSADFLTPTTLEQRLFD